MILNRLREYIDFRKIAVSAFEKSLDMSYNSLSKSMKTGGAIGTDKLERIIWKYPDINPTWLLTGEGNMLRTDEPSALVIEPPKHPNLTDALDLLKAKDEQIDRLLGLLDKALSK